MKCLEYRAEMTGRPAVPHRYVESGLPNVVLHAGVTRYECPNGHGGAISIQRLASLHRLLTRLIASAPEQLGGAEIRFLRKHLGWSGADFARTMGVDPATVSRWENDKDPMGPVAERLLRLMAVRETPVDEYPTERLAEVAQAAAPRRQHLDVTLSGSGWREEAAA